MDSRHGGRLTATDRAGNHLGAHQEQGSGPEREYWGFTIIWPLPSTGALELVVAAGKQPGDSTAKLRFTIPV